MMSRPTTLSFILLAAFCAIASSTCATNNPCGSTRSCCDTKSGATCYTLTTQTCTVDVANGQHYICYAGQSSCSGTCFPTATYSCTNGKVTAKPPTTSSTTKAATTSHSSTTSKSTTSSTTLPKTTSSTTSSTRSPTTSSSTQAPTHSSTTSAPTTSSTPAAATTSTPAPAPANNCPVNTLACGAACYNPTLYCCSAGNLLQLQFCSTTPQAASTSSTKAAAPSTSSVTPAAPSTSTKPATSSVTPAAPSTSTKAATPSTSTKAAAPSTSSNTPVTPAPTGPSAPVVTPPAPAPISTQCGGTTCPSGQACCAGSCYDPTQFGCSGNTNQFLCPVEQASTQPAFWVGTIAHTGTAAFNPDPSGYTVYRNVKSFGAQGDGVTDDTAAINSAITAYGRCGQGCDSTTIRPAVVYFPAGKYLISSPIIQYYYTQLIGDATNLPSILAAPTFRGMAMIDSDPYASNGNNWYTNQNNFYRQIRNFIIDTTLTSVTWGTTGIHWQIAQATSITNVVFQMTQSSNHQGIWMENGSGGFVSDLIFYGGATAMWVGNQQFTSRNISVYNADTAIYMNWNWGWTFKTLVVSGCRIGLDMSSSGDSGQLVGSVILVDVTMTNTQTGIVTGTTASTQPTTSGSLLIDNGYFNDVGTVVATPTGSSLLAGSQGTVYVPTWGQGRFYNQAGVGAFSQGFVTQPQRPASLVDPNSKLGFYFERPRPQYEGFAPTAFINVKDNGAYGDGIHDDTAAIAAVLTQYGPCRIIYFPSGTYIISSTVLVPLGSRIVGEAWSQIMAKGAAFQDPTNPVPMWQIGNPGDVGTAELSDLLFTASGPQPGAILVQWNIQDPVGHQGSSGMWDCHFRIGGAAGTNQQVAQCPSLAAPTPQCVGTFLSLHFTSTSSIYLENVWVWTADHDLDGNGQVSIYNGRGLLSESQSATWMYGTAVEHNVFYQYTFLNAKNVLLAMIQTETPYFQAAPPSPAPWTGNSEYSDPDFSHCPADSPSCGMAWGMRHVGSSNVFTYGAGHYNFFQNYNQTCLTTEDCQDSMVDMEVPSSSNIYMFGLNTKASVAMVRSYGLTAALATDNVNTFCSTVHYLANAQ